MIKEVRGPLREDEKIPARGIYTESARLERLHWVREKTATDLQALMTTRLDPGRLTGNIENMIGAVEVPIGLAGPLQFNGAEAQGLIYAPLATSEGAVVASATRGATAITRSGGITTRTVGQRMMRVPLFELSSIHGAMLFADWLRQHVDDLRAQIQMVSRHARLTSVEPTVLGAMVYVSFVYETGDAAGQNMTTSCTWQACQWLMAQLRGVKGIEFKHFQIESNASGDKKVTMQTYTAGRGCRVVAECRIDREVMQQVLKTTPEQALHTYSIASTVSTQVGMVGFNFNIANIIAAVFTATGQDIACVHECSVGQLAMDVIDGDLYASLMLPCLIVGTVGGGTHLPGQHALLGMMGCQGAGKVARLAEIIAGFCLALELSTLAAVTSNEFASAHEKLGRNRPVRWLTPDDLSPAFFDPILQEALADPALRCERIQAQPLPMGTSILTELTSRKVNKLLGHFPLRVEYQGGSGARDALSVVAKVKPLDEEVLLMTGSVAQTCGGNLATTFGKYRSKIGFSGCHTRELAVYAQRDPRFVDHVPRIFGTHRNDLREAYVVVMERLDSLVLMNSDDDVSGWRREHIEAAVRGIGQIHAIWYGREAELRQQPWLGMVHCTDSMVQMSDFWEALWQHAASEFPELVRPEDLALIQSILSRLPSWWNRIEQQPRTLIHNDFNPRNLGFRAGDLRLCVYDWELATLHLPQHDLAELLCFVLDAPIDAQSDSPRHAAIDAQMIDHYIDLHRRTLMEASGRDIPADTWRQGYRSALYDLCVNRIGLYLMGHTVRRYSFMPRLLRTMRALLQIEQQQSAD